MEAPLPLDGMVDARDGWSMPLVAAQRVGPSSRTVTAVLVLVVRRRHATLEALIDYPRHTR